MIYKYIFTLFYCLVCYTYICCQPLKTQKLDSLKTLLSNEGQTPKKVEILNKLSWELKNTDPKLALEYATKAKNLSIQINDSLGLSFSLNNIGLYYKNTGKYDTSLYFYKQSFELRLKLGNELNIGRSYINLLNIYKAKGDFLKAIELGQKAETIFRNIGEHAEMATVQNNLGPLFIQIGDYNKALEYYMQSLKIRERLKDSIGIANVCINLGNYFDIIGNNTNALNYYKKAEKIFEQDNLYQELAKVYNNIGNIYLNTNNRQDAYFYYKKSIEIKERYGFTDDLMGTYINMGLIEGYYQNYEKSKELLLKALKGYQKAKNFYKICEIHLLIGNLLFKQRKYAEGKPHIDKANLIADTLSLPLLLVDIYRSLSEYYESTNSFSKAFYFLNRSSDLKDSLSENIQSSNGVYTAYLEEQKKNLELEQGITLKNIEIEKAVAKNNVISLISVITLIVTISVTILFFLLNKNKRLKLNAIEAEKKVNQSQQLIDNLIAEQEEQSINSLLKGQESERKRIAQELHDRLGSLLTSVKLYFKSINDDIEKIKYKNEEQFNLLNKLLDEALDEVRRISNDLASGVLVNFGLPEALKELCLTVEKAGKLQVNLYVYGLEKRMDYTLEVNIYRIVQELLTNCLKHAGANEITVQIICNTEKLILMVEDDGVGFNVDDAKLKSGMGLENINKRVSTIKGSLIIDSGKRNGTTTTVEVDLE
jgi:two-component system NarL family sensor kinase